MKNAEQEILNESKNSYRQYMVKFITNVVCRYYNFDVEEFLNYKDVRKREHVHIRQMIFWLLKNNTEMTLTDMSKRFKKHHATIIHNINTIQNLSQWDKKLRREMDELQELVTLRARASVKNLNLEDDFYFIDMNDLVALRINKNKAVVLMGFTEEEIRSALKNLPKETQKREFKNTGMFLIENKIL